MVLDVLEEDASVEAIRKLKNEVGVAGGKRKRREPVAPKLIPHVPIIGTYEIAWCARIPKPLFQHRLQAAH